MFVFKKNWSFAIALAIVFGIGGFLLYHIRQPNETVTVYTLPDPLSRKNPTNVPQPKEGAQTSTASTETQQPSSDGDSGENSIANAASVQNFADSGNTKNAQDNMEYMEYVSPDVIADADRYREWQRAMAEYTGKKDKLNTEIQGLAQEAMALVSAYLSPEERARFREAIGADRAMFPALFDDNRPASETAIPELKEVLSKLNRLEGEFNELEDPPELTQSH